MLISCPLPGTVLPTCTCQLKLARSACQLSSLGAVQLALHRASHHAVAREAAAALAHPPQRLDKEAAVVAAAAAAAAVTAARRLALQLVTFAPAEARGAWALKQAAGIESQRLSGSAAQLAMGAGAAAHTLHRTPPLRHPRLLSDSAQPPRPRPRGRRRRLQPAPPLRPAATAAAEPLHTALRAT